MKPKPKVKGQTKPSGYNVFGKQKFAEISAEYDHLTNAEIMKIVGSRWKALSKDEQKVYSDMAEQKTISTENQSAATTIHCVFCDKNFPCKEAAKKHMKEHMNRNTGNQLNRFVPDQNQDQIKSNVCGLMINKNNLDEHRKSHEPEITLEEITVVDDIESNESNGDNVMEEDASPLVVMVKMRTKYWPAQVMSASVDSYVVVLCKRGDRLTIKKADCKEFTNNPDMCKGQSRDWKECFKAAVELVELVQSDDVF